MTVHDPALGSQAVSRLSQLDDLEACVVIYLRLWCAGPQGRCAMRSDLTIGLGKSRAALTTKALPRWSICWPCTGAAPCTVTR